MSLSTLIAETEELVKDIPDHRAAVEKLAELVPELETAIADLKTIVSQAKDDAAELDPKPVESISVPTTPAVPTTLASPAPAESDEIAQARSALDELIARQTAKDEVATSTVAAPLPEAS